MTVGLAIVVAWGLNFPLQKALLTAMQPEGFLFLRFGVMPLMVIGLLLYRYRLAWPRVSRADAWALTRLGLLGQGLHLTWPATACIGRRRFPAQCCWPAGRCSLC
ncbi:hypothetical protein ACVBEH_19610 [Roseateles sp. GG27B]